MISIHFEKAHDCHQLFQQLQGYLTKYAELGLKGGIEAGGDETLYVNYENQYVNFYDSFQPLLASIFTDYVISTKEEEWLLDIIENMFYFTDEEEKEQIVAIARSILEGDLEDMPSLSMFTNRREYIYQAFSKHIEENMTFYYDPFLTFRLREYGELLIDCVELAIDEYMMEQEYQSMVETLRQFIHSRIPKRGVIYAVYDERFHFYDEHFRLISTDEIVYDLKEELVFEHGLSVEEMVISPLVSMLPETVKVFTNDEEHGVILTLQAIFQERLKVFPLKDSPHQHREE
ncbi:putative sporulation protein YtxC [Halalkalibacterium halodurans]|uniref:BH3142 protein n=2 Tax=Halalkalibacterium halodurans TaxID=86665 RepID=Q9K865_HALH5|nr:putative sporulation protein YtxC [Halalkalibacterium halodurans]MDY7223675.1 putative sporulation protein YtxC [Halalkalibacterium halodurans]MDY7242896.1 putative sporulation protein YtxC [Halalkalibacterium halodurans]MED3645657.1 putative sporulation protein YtxC [Halalkalibacterium halodurans]MED4082124.1 putative sporulation protein YtxC [Halalkalibacterium halodurans]MED4084298.1 putative sporulation protein YtxC [Halalkalibacterium halodurans]